MVVPFFLPLAIEKIGLFMTTLAFSGSCLVGQLLFIMGLQSRSYLTCLVGRVIFGVSDCMTISQQTIMCLWFDNDSLPLALSLLLFQVKLARAVNDNFASIIYNHSHSLVTFFNVGLGICIFSFICTIVLFQIHKKMITQSGN